jgi:MFS transporter, ACS family, solute carrier family 17 (sodium-dependent inorganic phosphate cotransporter), other
VLSALLNYDFNLQSFPPVLQLLTSMPFWALLLLQYGNLWGLYFLITAAPKFITEVLGFDIAEAGFLSSLPYLARFCAGFMFGSIGDCIRRKGVISTTFIRKSFCLFCKY